MKFWQGIREPRRFAGMKNKTPNQPPEREIAMLTPLFFPIQLIQPNENRG